jgi:hypothetical protein
MGLAALGAVDVPNSVPQTRQRVAFSLNRVPQVGQILVGGVVVSGLMFPHSGELPDLRDYTSVFRCLPLSERVLFFWKVEACGVIHISAP